MVSAGVIFPSLRAVWTCYATVSGHLQEALVGTYTAPIECLVFAEGYDLRCFSDREREVDMVNRVRFVAGKEEAERCAEGLGAVVHGEVQAWLLRRIRLDGSWCWKRANSRLRSAGMKM